MWRDMALWMKKSLNALDVVQRWLKAARKALVLARL